MTWALSQIKYRLSAFVKEIGLTTVWNEWIQCKNGQRGTRKKLLCKHIEYPLIEKSKNTESIK